MSSAVLLPPSFGLIVVVCPLASSIVAALDGVAVGGELSVVDAALYCPSSPQDRIPICGSSLKTNTFPVIAQGTPEEIDRACDALQETEWGEAEMHRHGIPQAETQLIAVKGGS